MGKENMKSKRWTFHLTRNRNYLHLKKDEDELLNDMAIAKYYYENILIILLYRS